MKLVRILSFRGVLLTGLAGLGLMLAAACGSADDTGGVGGKSSGHGSSQSSGYPASDCPERCGAKAADCGAPPDVAANACGQLCGLSPTDAQLDCLEGKSCEELANASPGLCGIGTSTTSTSSNMNSASTSSGPSFLELGDSCTCSGGADLCQSTEGPCAPDLTCVLGVCAGSSCTGGDCPSGTECTEFIKDGFTLGQFCAVP